MTKTTETPHTETAGATIPFPPPLAYLVGMALGFALHLIIPMPVVIPAQGERALAIAGWSLLVLAASLVISAVVSFRQARTSHTFRQPSTCLIVRGPFRVSRNPVYLAGALFHGGVALLANALWPLVLLIPALAVVNVLITREERYLARRFGVEYETYCHRVRRWI